MKKILTVLLIALLALTVLGVTGVLLFRHFVADQIMDKGGMMNPDYTDGTDDVYILDGDHTYVDNEKLLQVIMGTWSSEDGHYTIKLDSDYRIILWLDGEPLLDDHIQLVYLQPGIVQSTEFSLDSCILQKEDGSHFESWGQYRYTWYLEGSEGASLLAVFNTDGSLYSVTSSIS